jgi:hypothetical protein
MKILKTYDLAPDGVRIEVNWDNMHIGTSIFVPCINTEEATKEVARICTEKGWEIESRLRIEDECLGVRFWRKM